MTSNCNDVEASSEERLVQKFPCKANNCNKAYIHRKDVIRHMRIRHGITPNKLEAVAVETPEKPHICGIGCCRRSYFHMKDLRRHQRLCHRVSINPMNSPNEVTADTSDLDKTQMRYPCDFKGCLRSYVHKKDLVRHKRLYHKDSSSKPTIPLPIRFTDVELKEIRQKVKQEIDTKEQKMRLDSTGSNVSLTNSDCSETVCLDHHVNIADDSKCTVLLSSSSTLEEVKANSDLRSSVSSDVASILGALEHHTSQLFGTD